MSAPDPTADLIETVVISEPDSRLIVLRDKMVRREAIPYDDIATIIFLLFQEMQFRFAMHPLARAIAKFPLNRPLSVEETAEWWSRSTRTVFESANKEKNPPYNRLRSVRIGRRMMIKPSWVSEYENRGN